MSRTKSSVEPTLRPSAGWSRFIEIVVSVAGDMGVGSTEGGEVMAFLDSLKADIVTA